MIHDEWSLAHAHDVFNTYISRMSILTPTTKLVGQALRRIADTRTPEHERPDGMFLVYMWEIEEETGLVRSTVREGLNQLVKYQIIRKTVIRAKVNKSGELWLSRIDLASLEHAELSENMPQKSIASIVRCRVCGDVHVVDAMTRTCKCGDSYTLYQTDHGANYDQVVRFCKACLQRMANCHLTYGQVIRLYKAWFWKQEEPGTKKPLKGEGLKRVMHDMGVEYKESHDFRRFEGIGLSPEGQRLLEGQA